MEGMKTHPYPLRIPEEPINLWKALRDLAKRNHGSVGREIILAIEDRLIKEGVLKDWRKSTAPREK